MDKKWRNRTWPTTSILQQGQKLSGVVMDGGGRCGGVFGFGDPDIEAITVQMEPGQCGWVPWALVECKGDGADELLNLANALEVFLSSEQER